MNPAVKAVVPRHYQTPASKRAMQSYEWLRFFDHYLKGIDTGLDKEKCLFYFTIGEERWKVTDRWPVAGTQMTAWYFNANNSLTTKAPNEKARDEDRYTINFEATTGAGNRCHTQVGGEVVYPDRAEKAYLTEGQLRALHRRVSNEQSPTKLPVPYHTFLKKDAMPLVPGEVADLKFGLQPIFGGS